MSKTTAAEQPALLKRYREECCPKLREEFKYDNVMQVPKVSKIVINIGAKEAAQDIKLLELLREELAQITGQKPVITKTKKSIAGFKVRDNVPIGLKVTLRGHRMYEFMDRAFNIAMPRIRDFRGYSPKSFDGQGNYTFGIQDQSIFPEVKFEKMKRAKGMDVTLVTTAKTKEESKKLLELLGFPFRKPTA